MNKIKNKNKGITLIALIITIIVMLILVSVTITMAVNGGLFDYARKAASETREAKDAEQELANLEANMTVDELIDKYTAGSSGELPEYSEDLLDSTTGLLTKTAKYTDSSTKVAVIPKGFAIVPGLNGTTTIADGLVITDELDANGQSIGNEFVWIPVTVATGDTETGIALFYRSNWSNNARGTTKYTATTGNLFNEPLSPGGYTNEQAEYNEMLKSVYDNGGFYIGRFEAGSTTARANVPNETTELVVKRDAYPYNYVSWGATMSDYTNNVSHNGKNQGKGAFLLSKELYGTESDKGKYGVTSTLCYGIMWDAMLDFIKDDAHNVTDGTTWGNYISSMWTITRKTAKYKDGTTWNLVDSEPNDKKEHTSGERFLLTTGASDGFAAKNIFDVAGNCAEWTNEVSTNGLRIVRGRLLLWCVDSARFGWTFD